jgi:hypothetical protein
MNRYLPVLSAIVVPLFVSAASIVLCASGQLNGIHVFLPG